MARGLMDEPQGGFFGGLQDAFTNPLTLGGLGLLSGEGFGGAMQGMRTGAGFQDQRRKLAEQQAQGQRFNTALEGLGGQFPPELTALARAQGPSAMPDVFKYLMDQRDPSKALDMDYKRAQIGKLQREASGQGDFGKTGAVFQGPDGRFYTVQFGSDGSRRIEPVETGGQSLTPARGVQVVGDEVISSATGGTVRNVAPQIAGAEEAKAGGKARGEAINAYESLTSKMPGLERVVDRLDELSKKATYTMAGQLRDMAVREAGMEPSEAMIARAEYTAIVDNQILPLLRDTFGAQFTQKEGETLKATLGDVNKAPAEKQALLRAFIEQKKRDIEALALQAGTRGEQQTPANSDRPPEGIDAEDWQYMTPEERALFR